MGNIIRTISFIVVVMVMTMNIVSAKIWVGDPARKSGSSDRKAAECVPATGTSQLSVNNVRAYIETSGSMWFRNSVAQYFIPKEGQASSMFAAALWIGGRDVAGQLKLAAIRFRQIGNDFWPGPLTLRGASIDQATCAKYDKHYSMSKNMARDHMLKQNVDPDYVMPDEIRNWPGNPIDGNKSQSWYLAPYMDVDGDGAYVPENGDYPYYDFENVLCPWTPENRARAARGELPQTLETQNKISTGGIMADQVLKGDETLWWIFNDKGAAHTETKGEPIGLEIRAQAFGFATTDELNNMTFYSYEIINRSTYALTETYFSQWVDPDVGYQQDDYVGCDVERGLGYCYNGKTPDGNGLTTDYGDNPPAVGVDFFQGPYLDPDGYDNPSYKKKEDNNIYGPAVEAAFQPCEIVTANGTLREFTWDSTGFGDTVRRSIMVRAEAINGVNFGDGIVDNERYGMRRFVYHNNDNTVLGDPSTAVDYYNLLRAFWKDNSRMRFGKNGHINQTTSGAPEADFMFPGDSDPCNWGTNGAAPGDVWTEENVSNQYGDRRFMQSAGPFTLKAGSINYITVGIPWARAIGTPWASVDLLKVADDKAQILFESCFKVIDGPDAPDLAFREMDKTLLCYITNASSSSNYKESYAERDPSIPSFRIKETRQTHNEIVYIDTTIIGGGAGGADTTFVIDSAIRTIEDPPIIDTIIYDPYYRFEGYQIYQLVNSSVGDDELSDPTKAMLVYQCDIKNGVKQIVNYEYNAVLQTEVPVEKVNGEDKGIVHSFPITEDKFGGALINHKKYYYKAVAYAHNSYAPYVTSVDNPDGLYGQKTPYLLGNKNIKLYTVIPHITSMEEFGTIVQSEYGSQPQITQVEGHGNGRKSLQLTQKTLNEILTSPNHKADSLVFERNHGPIDVKVVDPLKVIGNDFTLRFYNTDGSFTVGKETRWMLEFVSPSTGLDTAMYSDTSISIQNEQFLLDLGLSISIFDARYAPLDDFVNSNNNNAYLLYSSVEYLSSSLTFKNTAHPWITFLPDADGTSAMNWIRGGTLKNGDANLSFEQRRMEDFYIEILESTNNDTVTTKETRPTRSIFFLDKDYKKDFGQIINASWSPYALASIYDNNPGYGFHGRESEGGRDTVLDNDNHVITLRPRMTELYSVDVVFTADKNLWTRCPVVEISDDVSSSVGGAVRHNLRKSPSVDKNGNPDGSGTGMGWFPGYAICVETGERLNVMFGENSSLPNQNGADMLFNPTSLVFDVSGEYVAGGGHYLYIFGHRDLYSQQSSSTYIASRISSYYTIPVYDQGRWIEDIFQEMEAQGTNQLQRSLRKSYIYKNVMWTTIPLANTAYPWLENGNDATVSIRVSRPYQRWSSQTNVGVSNPINNNMPLYRFSTRDLAALHNQRNVAANYMDSIYVTPNPYYGISGYETSQLDTRVKFLNLPSSCKIKIFTLDGVLIRSFDKSNDGTTYVEWDLKNSANIPIASGMYLIHIRDNTYNTEKTLKFLCIQRPVDVNAF